jgi:hypothetical protein
VIGFENEWRFRDYLDGRETNVILEWSAGLPATAQAKLDTILLLLRVAQSFPPQYVSALRGYEGILELRIGSCGVQYRPLGCYGPNRKEFTLLIGSIEKGGKLPKADCETAVERRKKILKDRRRTCEHDFGATRPRGKI